MLIYGWSFFICTCHFARLFFLRAGLCRPPKYRWFGIHFSILVYSSVLLSSGHFSWIVGREWFWQLLFLCFLSCRNPHLCSRAGSGASVLQWLKVLYSPLCHIHTLSGSYWCISVYSRARIVSQFWSRIAVSLGFLVDAPFLIRCLLLFQVLNDQRDG